MSTNPEMDRIEDRVTTLEKRCALLERHYAPTEHNPDSARLAALLERLERAGVTLLDWDTDEKHDSPAPKNEPCFTLDAYLRVTHDPCAVCRDRITRDDESLCFECNCRDRITRDDESLCFECNIQNWTYGNPMPSHFELHEDLK